MVRERDDLSIEFCSLLLAAGRYEEAAEIVEGRRFQPWEGGEGQALGIFTRIHIALAKRELEEGRPEDAVARLARVIDPPSHLGEARHLLANASDAWLAYGDALIAAGRQGDARGWWERAATFRGDFQEMSVQTFSELTVFQAIAQRRLGWSQQADGLLRELEGFAQELMRSKASIDYFATSLPTMLLFEDDIQARQENRARFMMAQAAWGLGDDTTAGELLAIVLAADPNHGMALDLQRSMHRE
jgi:hypothetical protein